MSKNMWAVLRHGGKNKDEWLPLYEGEDETLARDTYQKKAREMRQGGLQLLQGGTVVEEKHLKRPNFCPPPQKRKTPDLSKIQ